MIDAERRLSIVAGYPRSDRARHALTRHGGFLIAKKPDPLDIDVSFKGRCEVATGTVKWFNPTKGYSLQEGAKVSFDVVSNRGKESAENLKIG